MSATIKGRPVVFSTGAIVLTVGTALTNLTQSLTFNRQSDKAEVKDGTKGGAIVTQIFHAFKKTLSLTVIPASADTTLAGAVTASDAHLIRPGVTATITDDKSTQTDASYNVISSRMSRTVDGVETVDLELEQSDDPVDAIDLTVATT